MITFTSEITVRLIQSMGGDHMAVAAARASTSGAEAEKYSVADQGTIEANAGLINYLAKQRHGVPFEHSAMTFFVHAPMFVWWEWIRHRIGQTISCPGLSDDVDDASFSLESGRYKKLEPVFWCPRRQRKMTPSAKHKPARPDFEPLDDEMYEFILTKMCYSHEVAWAAYEGMIGSGIANEVARSVLGTGIYYSGWVTCNPRSLMAFLSLRTHDPDAKYISYPQAEIEEAARAAEAIFAQGWPLTHAAFCKNGRVAP
jgi:thymidylate synthase (FAD)